MPMSVWRHSWSSAYLLSIAVVVTIQHENTAHGFSLQRYLYNCSQKESPARVIRLPCDTNKNGKIDKSEQECHLCDRNHNGILDPFEVNCTQIHSHTANASSGIPIFSNEPVSGVGPRVSATLMDNKDMIEHKGLNGTQVITFVEKVESEYLWLIANGLSIIGSLFIIISFIVLKEIRTMAYGIIFYLSIADLFWSVASVVDILTYDVDPTDDDADDVCLMEGCVVAAAFKLYFQLCSMLWSSVIAMNMLLVIVIKVKVKTLRAWQTLYHVVTWVVSFVGTAVAFFLSALGDTGYRCGIVHSPAGMKVEVALVMIPMCSILVFNVICFTLVIGCFRLSFASVQRKRIGFRLSLYALVFLLVRLPSVVSYFVVPRTLAYGEEDTLTTVQLVVLYVEAVMTPLQGFGDGLVYGLNKQVIKTYKENCRKCCNVDAKYNMASDNEPVLTQKDRFSWSKNRPTVTLVEAPNTIVLDDSIDTKRQGRHHKSSASTDTSEANDEFGEDSNRSSINCEPLLGLDTFDAYNKQARASSARSDFALMQQLSSQSINSATSTLDSGSHELTDIRGSSSSLQIHVH